MTLLLVATVLLRDEVADAIKKLRAAADTTARYQAEADLGRILKPQQIPLVVKEIDAGPAELRPHFIRAIRWVGGKEAVAALKVLLTRHEWKSRVEAAYALKLLGEDDAMKSLPAEVQRPNLGKDDRLAILAYLYSYYSDAKEVPGILRRIIAGDKDADVRKAALLALSSHKDPESVPFLKRMAQDDADPLRSDALCALIRTGEADAVEEGLRAMESGGLAPQPLSEILFALRAAGGRDVAARLRALLEKATDVSVKMQLIHALSQLKDSKSVSLLSKLVEDKNPSVAEAAVEALVALAGRGQVDLLRRLLKREPLSLRLKAAEALVALDDPSGVPVLREALDEKTAYTRQRAATALGNFHVPEAVPPLLVAMADEDANVRQTASSGLLAALKHLYPYRKFDLASVGYDPKGTDAAARAKAVVRLQEWWERNK